MSANADATHSPSRRSRVLSELEAQIVAARDPEVLYILTLRAIRNEDYYEMRTAANARTTHPRSLDLLADIPIWSIVEKVGLNPRTASVSLDRILGVNGDIAHPEVRRDRNWRYVLEKVGWARNLSPAGRRFLVSHPDPIARSGVASRPDLSDAQLVRLGSDAHSAVRCHAAYQLSRDPERIPGLLKRLCADGDERVRACAQGERPPAYGPHSPYDFTHFIATVSVRRPITMPRPASLPHLNSLATRIRSTASPTKIRHLAAEALAAGDIDAMRMCTERHGVPADVLAQFAHTRDPHLLLGVAHHENTRADTLDAIVALDTAPDGAPLRADRSWIHTMTYAATHRALAPRTRRALRHHADERVRAAIASRTDLSDYEIVRCSRDEHPMVRANAAQVLRRDPDRMPLTLEHLSRDPDPRVAACAQPRPSALPDLSPPGYTR